MDEDLQIFVPISAEHKFYPVAFYTNRKIKEIFYFFSTDNEKMKCPDMDTEQHTINDYFPIEINWCEN